MRTAFTVAALAALAGLFTSSVATPAKSIENRQASLYCASGTPQCCAVDVLGVVSLNCETRKLTHLNELALYSSKWDGN